MATNRYLVDTSVWVRLHTYPEIRRSLREIALTRRPRVVMICPPVSIEVGRSTEMGVARASVMRALVSFRDCPRAPSTQTVINLQNLLWKAGIALQMPSHKVLIAAYAVVNNAAILHFDRDFQRMAKVIPDLRQAWVVPPATRPNSNEMIEE